MDGEHNTPALLIVAHGSAERPEDNLAVVEMAERVARATEFGGVRAGFIKAEPDARAVLAELAGDVVIVPLLMSEGFFYSNVLPKKLGLATGEVRHDGRRVVYAGAVGTHPGVIELVRARVDEAREKFALPELLHLLLVGHGTRRHSESSLPTRERARQLAATDEFSQVSVAFLDEAPLLDEVLAEESDDLLVVPDFIGEGLHTRVDIPEALGLVGYEGGFSTGESHGRRAWYTPPVGTHPGVMAIIADRAREGARKVSTD